jgi:hypothetical protein
MAVGLAQIVGEEEMVNFENHWMIAAAARTTTTACWSRAVKNILPKPKVMTCHSHSKRPRIIHSDANEIMLGFVIVNGAAFRWPAAATYY